MGWLAAPFVFLFITVPSIVYSVSAWIFLPIGLLLRLFAGRSFAIRTFPSVFYNFILPIFLILGVPLILYFYVLEPLGWIFCAWMIIYFVSRRFSGVHKWQVRYFKGLKELDALDQKTERINKPSASQNWFQRNINLTLIAVVVGTYLLTMVTSTSAETTGQGRSLVGSLIQLMNPTISNQTMSWYYLPIWVALMLPVEGWVLSKKKRSMWHLLWAITPFGWIIILWLGSPKIDGNELQDCLAYFEAETKIMAFQTKEADLYNNAMVKYRNSIIENPLAAREACKAAKRLHLSAGEVLRRHNEITNVPAPASLMHFEWYAAILAYASWASASVAAIEAMAKGMSPDTMYIQQLFQEHQKAWKRAQDEDKKFLKRLKVSAEDIAKMVARATTIGAADDGWEPKTDS